MYIRKQLRVCITGTSDQDITLNFCIISNKNLFSELTTILLSKSTSYSEYLEYQSILCTSSSYLHIIILNGFSSFISLRISMYSQIISLCISSNFSPIKLYVCMSTLASALCRSWIILSLTSFCEFMKLNIQ